MTKKTLTQQSKEYLERQGYTVDIVERQIPHSFIKKDLFGMFDLIALKGSITYGIQVTSKSNMSKRVKKISGEPRVNQVRDANWTILVHGWEQNKKGIYTLREVDLS